MNDEVKQGEINKAAWKICDIFRGVMDANDYKDYILTMLFLKYISDVWDDKVAELKRKYKDDTARINRAKRNERFQLPKGTSFYDLYASRYESNIGERINKALDGLENANKKKLEGVFRGIDFNSESHLGTTNDRNRRLRELLEIFNTSELDLHPSQVSEDIIGNTYIYLIDKFAAGAGKKAGEYYTPYMVSRLIARLCGPTSGARICDPACGSGSLLIEAARVVQDKDTGSRNYSLYGMEVNGGTWALCRMNMFLHRFDSADIRWCNTLTEPKLADGNKLMQFDYLVSNPPFSLKNWGAEAVADDRYNRFYRGVPPKSKGDFAFISHMVEAVTPRKGRIAVVVPHGVLFRSASEGNIRQKLVDENLLDAVVGLPSNLFQTTSIPVAILVFDRSREKGGANAKRRDVLFIDASRDYEPGKKQNALLESHLEKILGAYSKRQEKAKYAHLASLDEIKENDYNLNIPRYVDTYEEEEEIDISETKKEILRLEQDLKKTRDRMDVLLKEIGV